MPSYKLCYFQARGFTEALRLTFVEAGVEYEDVRFSGEEWPKHKPDMLFNQIPVLFVDGVQIAHSRAALRYLGRKFNLDGGDALTAAKVDMWIEVLVENILKMLLDSESDEKQKEEQAVIFRAKLARLENAIQGDYIFGANPTIADFNAYCVLDVVKSRAKEDFLANSPKIKKMMAAVASRPKIANWIKQRPDSEF